MIETIAINLTKHICQHFYQNDKDNRFRYWIGIPDWDGYLAYLSQPKNIDQENSFGGFSIEHRASTTDWGLANKTDEYQITVYLMHYLNPRSERKLQEDMNNILSIFFKNSTVLKHQFYFDRNDLSGLMRRAKIGVVCAELKVNILVDKE